MAITDAQQAKQIMMQDGGVPQLVKKVKVKKDLAIVVMTPMEEELALVDLLVVLVKVVDMVDQEEGEQTLQQNLLINH